MNFLKRLTNTSRYRQQSALKQAFTLSELLIAVAILGLIATFTIPKVLQATDTQVNKAKFKESIASISTVVQEGVLSGGMTYQFGTSSNNGTFLLSRLASTKQCNGNSRAQGCAPSTQTGYSDDWYDPGLTLHNGAMMYGLNDFPYGYDAFVLDSNGEGGPNTVGVDMLVLAYCYDEQGCPTATIVEAMPFPPFKIVPMWTGFSSNAYRDANKALYLSLFQ